MLVTTTHGLMDDSLLEKREGVNPPPPDAGVHGCSVAWVEYWLEGELVHRSATATPVRH
jgi:hypothetical protein